jgi:hypothetical protein
MMTRIAYFRMILKGNKLFVKKTFRKEEMDGLVSTKGSGCRHSPLHRQRQSSEPSAQGSSPSARSDRKPGHAIQITLAPAIPINDLSPGLFSQCKLGVGSGLDSGLDRLIAKMMLDCVSRTGRSRRDITAKSTRIRRDFITQVQAGCETILEMEISRNLQMLLRSRFRSWPCDAGNSAS